MQGRPGPLDDETSPGQHEGMEEPHGNWIEEMVFGHRCRLFEPRHPNPHGYTIVYLHCSYAASLRSIPPFAEAIGELGLRVVEPVSGLSWWTDRIWPPFDANITAESYLLQRVVPFLAERWSASPPRLALLGISMGGQAALRIAYKHPTVFPTVAAISPAIDFQKRIAEGIDPGLAAMYRDEEDARQDTATLHIHPLNWPRHQFFCCDPTDVRWHESCERLRMKLYSLGVPFECDLETVAGGHSFEYAGNMAPRVMDFIMKSLEHERLRV